MRPVAIAVNQFCRGGGMESYTLDMVRGFSARGIRPQVYAAKVDDSLPEYALAELRQIDQRRIPKKLRPFFFSAQLARRRDPNVQLIACNPSDHADVFVCGGTHLGYLQHMGQRANLLDKLIIRRGRSNYASTRSIMAHSQLMAAELQDLYGVAAEKIRVVYPPADTQRYFPRNEQSAALRHRFGFSEEETIFLFPSTGHQRKGLAELAAFFAGTDLPLRLVVAGSPLPRPLRKVSALGFCRDMPDLYRAADFTIMASLYEPFGLVGIESLLCGSKVVFAENIGCTEVMQEAGFFFKRGDAAGLARAIEAAHAEKQSGRHKVDDPLALLRYDPSLSAHMQALSEMLAAASAR